MIEAGKVLLRYTATTIEKIRVLSEIKTTVKSKKKSNYENSLLAHTILTASLSESNVVDPNHGQG